MPKMKPKLIKPRRRDCSNAVDAYLSESQQCMLGAAALGTATALMVVMTGGAGLAVFLAANAIGGLAQVSYVVAC